MKDKDNRNTKHSWRDVSIDEYFTLKSIIEDTSLEEYDKEVKTLALLNDMTDEEVWQLPINEFRKLQVEKLWTNEFNMDTKKSFRKLKINGDKYDIMVDLQKMNVAQYIDFQTFWAKRDDLGTYIGNLLAIFIIPKGHEYADGYDINETVSDIRANLDIMTAEEILFFFLNSSLNSMRAILAYLNWKIERMKKKGKLPDERALEMKRQLSEMKSVLLDGFFSLTK